MKKIKDGSITLRSRYVFVARRLGLGGALGLSIVLAIFSFSLVMFVVEELGSIELLGFGENGLLAFLESFPYLWVVLGVLGFVAASWLLTRYDFSYKRPFMWFIVALVGIVLAGSIGLEVAGTHGRLGSFLHGQGSAVFSRMHARTSGRWGHIVVGRVESVDLAEGKIDLRVPDAAGTTVRIDDDTSLPREGILRVGALLRVVGSWQDGYFKAEAIRPWRHGTSHPIGQGAGPL